jgi:hypothetical protein
MLSDPSSTFRRAMDPKPAAVRVPNDARLHLAMHEIIATHLWDDDPPEAWGAAARLGHRRRAAAEVNCAPLRRERIEMLRLVRSQHGRRGGPVRPAATQGFPA